VIATKTKVLKSSHRSLTVGSFTCLANIKWAIAKYTRNTELVWIGLCRPPKPDNRPCMLSTATNLIRAASEAHKVRPRRYRAHHLGRRITSGIHIQSESRQNEASTDQRNALK